MREATFTNALMDAMLRAMPTRRTLSSSELRRAAKSIAPFVHAFDLMQEHVIITDSNAHILYANSATEHATGFPLSQMLGKNPADLWGGHMSRDFHRRMWLRLKREKMPFSGEVRNIRKDGKEVWQELHISPVADPRGRISFYIAVESVITKRKKHEDAREAMHSIISNEALSPLAAMRWSLERREESVDVAAEWHVAEEALREECPHINLSIQGHARIRSVRSLVRELSKRVSVQCTLTKTGKRASLVFSLPFSALPRQGIDLSIPFIIARYLRWEGPVERKKGNMHQWIIRVPPHLA